jgi:hypothetical protein
LAEKKIANQVVELRNWYDATLGRELRIIEMKVEVNELLVKAGLPPRYPGVK